MCFLLTWKEIPEINRISVAVHLRFFRFVPIEVLAISTPPQVLLVLTGHHKVLAGASAGDKTVAVVVAP